VTAAACLARAGAAGAAAALRGSLMTRRPLAREVDDLKRVNRLNTDMQLYARGVLRIPVTGDPRRRGRRRKGAPMPGWLLGLMLPRVHQHARPLRLSLLGSKFPPPLASAGCCSVPANHTTTPAVATEDSWAPLGHCSPQRGIGVLGAICILGWCTAVAGVGGRASGNGAAGLYFRCGKGHVR